jgi:uncharacterized protein (DUF2267 family)
MRADDFWEALRDRFTPGSEEELRSVTHHVLLHLRHRLPDDEAQMLFAVLPAEIAPLGASESAGHAERLDAPAFYAHVGREAHVPQALAEEATGAVFGVLRRVVPLPTAARIERALPDRLRAVWHAAA